MTKMATMYPFRMRVANKKPQKTKNEADGNAVWIVWATAWPLGAKKKKKKKQTMSPNFSNGVTEENLLLDGNSGEHLIRRFGVRSPGSSSVVAVPNSDLKCFCIFSV